MENIDILIAPIISEKSMADAKENKFTFKVAMHSNKRNIKSSVQDRFKVKVLSIRTSIVKGKKSRFGTRRVEVLKSPWKKAIIKLAKGQKIDLFEVATS